MAILEIVQHPSPILTESCKPVTDFGDALQNLLDDMYETMVDADGIGIAAPQVGEAIRAAIVDLGEGQDPIWLINPEVVATGGKETEVEGCLSFPGLYGEVERPYHIKVHAQDRDGSWYELEAEDYEARAVLHEIDHLNGILFDSKIIRVVTEEELQAAEEEDEEE
ncbi:peptide deformylase [Bhargavaea ginsengi]|uniref:Peptide deformylase n=1 Tax=Bhargavaea ginsengi TaxID=426757 RepID=A0A1H6SVK2_9BACL|nr:peptide deformylase [Bhargavaea ginsengi]MCM3087372.1 peptide deformylase [Bhargavaea ginsengi]SEI70896.1 peptide deformylase [Bhargavaea ginsengi]